MTLVLHRPTTVEQAIEALHDDALVLAGGQSLVLLMNAGLLQPAELVSVTGIEELWGIRRTADALDLGALCTHDQLATNETIRRHIPAMARMFAGVGNPRVRSAGTLGGNIVHADPAQDPPVLLAAFGATVDIVGPSGVRTLPTNQLADGPMSATIDADELVTRIHVPLPDADTTAAYTKFLSGSHDDYATVSIAATVTATPEGIITAARLTAGAVGPTVVELSDAAQVLIGQVIDADVLAAVHAAARDAVQPFPDRRGSTDYKREMTGVIAARTVQDCLVDHPQEATS